MENKTTSKKQKHKHNESGNSPSTALNVRDHIRRVRGLPFDINDKGVQSACPARHNNTAIFW